MSIGYRDEAIGGESSYTVGILKRIYVHNRNLKSLYIELNHWLDIKPGQFLMVWIPGYEEIPISPSYSDGELIRLTVKGVGDTSKKLINMNMGDRVYVRGPYGTYFKIDDRDKYLLVGGGYGAAPLIFLAHKLVEMGLRPKYVEGVKSISEQLFIKEAESLGLEATLVTEDGSSGIRGLVTDYIVSILDNFDSVLACGPTPMLDKVLDLCRSRGINCQLSYESIVKCGIGVCGSCTLGNTGLLICFDGPVLDINTLNKWRYRGSD